MRAETAISLLFLAAACQTAPTPEIGGAAAIQEFAPLYEAYAAGMVSGDAEAIAALYSSDAVEMTPGDFRNREDIVAHYAEVIEAFDFPVWDF